MFLSPWCDCLADEPNDPGTLLILQVAYACFSMPHHAISCKNVQHVATKIACPHAADWIALVNYLYQELFKLLRASSKLFFSGRLGRMEESIHIW